MTRCVVQGGKEAECTCRLLADIIRSAIESTPCSPPLPAAAITLVSTRDDVAHLLSMHQVTCDLRSVTIVFIVTVFQHIDLVIPRGSAALVKHVSDNTKIPVMGHR